MKCGLNHANPGSAPGAYILMAYILCRAVRLAKIPTEKNAVDRTVNLRAASDTQ